ncbi:hypothetical protein [Anaeromicropila populeti]|uniref:Uncharacterized protein n=1 Tax=Anaeromicropila populeti TaxID=37658 RepID=A0A1I6KY05_9FIRM|nr:hypothetical protein [Anaeromicropila populeti]SFR96116.1 hypothetical protein SAMN05661086_02879 [Anaeromicropila populeti]
MSEKVWKKKEKGEHGFISYRKRRYLIAMGSYVLTGLGIFVIGLLTNHMSPKNMGSVLAMLMSLPFAKAAVGFLILAPYKDVSEENYKKIDGLCKPGVMLYSDLVFTSTEKVMNLSFLAETDGTVIGLVGKPNQNVQYIEEYLGKGIRNWGYSYSFRLYQDEGEFIKEMGKLEPKDIPVEEKKQVKDYLMSLIVC